METQTTHNWRTWPTVSALIVLSYPLTHFACTERENNNHVPDTYRHARQRREPESLRNLDCLPAGCLAAWLAAAWHAADARLASFRRQRALPQHLLPLVF